MIRSAWALNPDSPITGARQCVPRRYQQRHQGRLCLKLKLCKISYQSEWCPGSCSAAETGPSSPHWTAVADRTAYGGWLASRRGKGWKAAAEANYNSRQTSALAVKPAVGWTQSCNLETVSNETSLEMAAAVVIGRNCPVLHLTMFPEA